MCNRTEIVTNGCTGACCSAVFFPYTVEEIKKIKEAKETGTSWVNDKGEVQENCYPKDEVVSYDYLIDMMIPLGYQTIDPERQITYLEIYKEVFKDRPDEFEKFKRELKPGMRMREDGEIEAYVVTCKHFDQEKKICNDYENRPGLCRRFGATCKYKDCTCAVRIAEEEEKRWQAMQKELGDQLMPLIDDHVNETK